MALEQKLSVRMSQRLVMTPSLQQAIKLLQMSKLELVEEVQQELLENPVLEESQADGETGDEPRNEDGSNEDPFAEIDYESYFQEVDRDYVPKAPRESGDDLPTFENTLSGKPKLADHLTWQLDLSTSSEARKEIGREIIGNIDEDGYLGADLDEIREHTGGTAEEVEATLEMIQGFDPVGVGARDLVECLTLQLRHLGEEGTAAHRIVSDHLELVKNRRFKELAAALDIEMEDLEAELEIVRGLDPKPGQKYSNEDSRYVIPDVYVVKVDDEYQVLVNEDGLPRLRVSPVYRRMIAAGNAEKASAETKEYVRNKMRSAFRLIKSLEERQRTIYKVATAIVKFQREFLDYGIDRMRPLVLKDVADEIGMHESTVSRVVNSKYMHTHRGVFEMRFFFHSGISSRHGGEAVSSLSVKEKIRKIVAAEDEDKPLSDSAIVKVLKEDGLKIARRTVAKYREELKIPSSSQRKRVFR